MGRIDSEMDPYILGNWLFTSRNWLRWWWRLVCPKFAEEPAVWRPREELEVQFKASLVESLLIFLLWPSTKWDPPTRWRLICFTQSQLMHVNLLKSIFIETFNVCLTRYLSTVTYSSPQIKLTAIATIHDYTPLRFNKG